MVERFKEWIVFYEWEEVTGASGSNAKVDAYQDTIVWTLKRFFPMKTTRKKSSDLPWMSKKIKKLIECSKRIYWQARGGEGEDGGVE